MNYYEETYNKFVKELALDELETLKETMIYEYNDLDSNMMPFLTSIIEK